MAVQCLSNKIQNRPTNSRLTTTMGIPTLVCDLADSSGIPGFARPVSGMPSETNGTSCQT